MTWGCQSVPIMTKAGALSVCVFSQRQQGLFFYLQSRYRRYLHISNTNMTITQRRQQGIHNGEQQIKAFELYWARLTLIQPAVNFRMIWKWRIFSAIVDMRDWKGFTTSKSCSMCHPMPNDLANRNEFQTTTFFKLCCNLQIASQMELLHWPHYLTTKGTLWIQLNCLIFDQTMCWLTTIISLSLVEPIIFLVLWTKCEYQ